MKRKQSSTAAFIIWGAVCILLLCVCKSRCDGHPNEVCHKQLWKVYFDKSFAVGEAMLRFNISHAMKEGGLYDTIVACDGLLVDGTGHQVLNTRKFAGKLAEFPIAIPMAKDEEGYNKYEKRLSHSCTFELRHKTKARKSVIHCQFNLETLQHRIMPECNKKRSKALIEDIEILKEEGEVIVTFKHSPNDVMFIDRDCDSGNILGHDTTLMDDEEKLFPLNPPGSMERVYATDFYPPCDFMNDSMKQWFMNHRMSDCHLEIYAVCQKGVEKIEELQIEFDDDAMYCYPPKPHFVEFLEHLELQFRVESKPVVALLFLLIIIGVLYVFLLPFAAYRIFRLTTEKCKKLQYRLALKFGNKKPRGDFGGLIKAQQNETTLLLEETPATTNTDTYTTKREISSPVMEYDDVETALLGKLSTKDLQGIFDNDSFHSLVYDEDSFESFDPLVYDVVVDVEPVTIQPLPAEPDQESFSDDQTIKRRQSSLKRRKSREKTNKRKSGKKSKASDDVPKALSPQTVSSRPLPPLPIVSSQQPNQVNPPQRSPVEQQLSPSTPPPPPPPPSTPPPPPPPPPLPSASRTPWQQQQRTTPSISPTTAKQRQTPTVAQSVAPTPLQPDITQELTAKLQARSKREAVSSSNLTTSQYPSNS